MAVTRTCIRDVDGGLGCFAVGRGVPLVIWLMRVTTHSDEGLFITTSFAEGSLPLLFHQRSE